MEYLVQANFRISSHLSNYSPYRTLVVSTDQNSGENMDDQSPADKELIAWFQRSYISFITFLNPNTIPQPTHAQRWPAFRSKDPVRMVLQRPNLTGQGIFSELDNVNSTICDFIKTKNVEFLS